MLKHIAELIIEILYCLLSRIIYVVKHIMRGSSFLDLIMFINGNVLCFIDTKKLDGGWI